MKLELYFYPDEADREDGITIRATIKAKRPDVHLLYITMAALMSTRGTCSRRRVGCVLVDERFHVLSTGYNGPASGMKHCIDEPCPGAFHSSGSGLEECEAIHAEQNALLQCPDVYLIRNAYCTTAPCIHCVKLLMNTSCRMIYFHEDYPHSEKAKKLWEDSSPGRGWQKI